MMALYNYILLLLTQSTGDEKHLQNKALIRIGEKSGTEML